MGFDIELVSGEIPDKYKCVHCEKLLQNPVQDPDSGYRLCRQCYESEDCDYKSSEGVPFPDKFVEREIFGLQCYCHNKAKGCDWQGTMRQLMEDHESQCPEAKNKVMCLFCGSHYVEEELVKCKFCEEMLKGSQLAFHENRCDQRQITCMFGCQKTIHHAEYNIHIEQCTKDSDSCPYQIIGCKYKCRSSSKEILQEHIRSDPVHISLVINKIESLEHANTELNKRLETSVAEIAQLRGVVEEKNKEIMEMNGRLKKIKGRIDKQGALFNKLAGPTTNGDVEKYMNSINKLLKLDERITDLQTKLDTGGSSKSKEVDYAVPEQALNQLGELSQERAKLSEKMSELSLKMQLLENKRWDGRMNWRIDRFRYRSAQARNGLVEVLHSAPAYSELNGYKFCLRLYLNGDGTGKGTHISLYFLLMKSEMDILQTWPFTKRVTFRLLNFVDSKRSHREYFYPDPTSVSFECPKGSMNIAAGCPKFIHLNELDSGFIVDDSLFFEVTIGEEEGKAGDLSFYGYS